MTPINALGQHPSGQNWRAQAGKTRGQRMTTRAPQAEAKEWTPGARGANEEALTALGSGTPRSEWGDKEYFADPSKA